MGLLLRQYNLRNVVFQSIIFKMKPQPPKTNTLDTIKQMEIKREERRKQMEELKKEKEEKKAQNLASGKNVDIDFEIMIDKNRYKDKLLQPHISSTMVKVSPHQLSSQCASGRGLYSRRRSRLERSTLSPAPTRRSRSTSLSTRWTASPNTSRTTCLLSTTPSMRKR